MREQFNNASREPVNVADLYKGLKLAFETILGVIYLIN